MLRRNLVFAFVACLLGVVYLLGCLQRPVEAPKRPTVQEPLPEHEVVKNVHISLKTNNRRKIVIYARADLTREGCLTLLSRYRTGLPFDSQVVVRKTSVNAGMKPWCVDNVDGSEILFNDIWFDPTHPVYRQQRK